MKDDTLNLHASKHNSPERPLVAAKEAPSHLMEDLLTSAPTTSVIEAVQRKSENHFSSRKSTRCIKRAKAKEEFERKQALLNRHRYFLVKEGVYESSAPQSIAPSSPIEPVDDVYADEGAPPVDDDIK